MLTDFCFQLGISGSIGLIFFNLKISMVHISLNGTPETYSRRAVSNLDKSTLKTCTDQELTVTHQTPSITYGDDPRILF